MAKVFEPHEYYKNVSLENIEGEEWIDIRGYEASYRISNLGRVKSLKRSAKKLNGERIVPEKILKQSKNHGGYLGVILSLNRVKTRIPTHRFVAMHFIPNPENKPEVNHKKGIKTDNRAKELEWATKAENEKHAVDNELKAMGERIHTCKISASHVRLIRDFLKNGITLKDVANKYGISISTVYEIKSRKIWKHIK